MEKDKIKISIIMASYNYDDFICNAIDSILSQTYHNWELIIVDDGSDDNSVEIIKKYCEKDKRINFFQHKNAVNKGLKETVLLGLKNASSEWITFLENDDFYKPNYLKEKVNAIANNPKAGLVFNDVEIFGEKKEIRCFDNYILKRDSILKNSKIKYEDLLVVNLIPSFSCVMVKKSILQTCDFNSPLPQCLDYFLWIQLYNKIQMVYLQEKLTYWRKHDKNYMKKADFAQSGLFDLELLKFLVDTKVNTLGLSLYGFTRSKRIEKLCRPQMNFISKLIVQSFLKHKSYDLIKI